MMSETIQLDLPKLPSTLNLYRKALLARGHGSRLSPELPNIELSVKRIRLDKKKVSEYATLCGYKFNGKHVPLTYLHLPAFNLHLELMVNKKFPLPVMGLVHIKNVIKTERSIQINELLDYRVFIADSRQTDKGFEFDIVTEVMIGQEHVWQSCSTLLYRNTKPVKATSKAKSHGSTYLYRQEWYLPENLGRKYAQISGDSNPIHLHSLSARLFGFKQAIAHGMWSKAKSVACLQPLLKTDAITVTVFFKQPIYLPSRALLHYQADEDSISFDVRNVQGDKLHMNGVIELNK